jgi:hypothetical protein
MTRRPLRFFEENKLELAEIELEYAALADGVSVGGRVCPKCKGGRTNEGSFAVSRKGTILLFQCHRASCGFKGMSGVGGRLNLHGNEQAGGEPVNARVNGPSRYDSLGKSPLPREVAEYLRDKYEIGLLLQAKGLLRWTTEHSPAGHGRLVMPALDPDGRPYGYVARKLDNQEGAKTLTFAEDTRGSWYFNRNSSSRLLIVEDQLSALKASQYINAVALLGTNLTENTLSCIKKGQYTDIYLALDADAFPKSIRMAVELRPRLKLSVIRLRKDIKDSTNKEIHELLLNEGALL